MLPNRGPWTDVKLSSFEIINDNVEEVDHGIESPQSRRSSIGSQQSQSSPVIQKQMMRATTANVVVGSKVFVTRDGKKTRCVVTKLNVGKCTADIKVDPDQYAPVAQTCTFSLKVPAYSSLSVMQRQLRRAIVEEGMHLD